MTRRNNNEKQNLDCGATGICHTREKTLIHHPYNTHAVPYGGNDFRSAAVVGNRRQRTQDGGCDRQHRTLCRCHAKQRRLSLRAHRQDDAGAALRLHRRGGSADDYRQSCRQPHRRGNLFARRGEARHVRLYQQRPDKGCAETEIRTLQHPCSQRDCGRRADSRRSGDGEMDRRGRTRVDD